MNYDSIVDTCEVRYASWAHLQSNEMVSSKKFDHLKLIPKGLMESLEFVTKVLWTIIDHHSSIHFSKLVTEFLRTTGFNLADHFDFSEDEMRQFLH